MIGAWREWLYERGVFRSVELPAFTISVGNISLGGTGKSPFVMYLCEWAKQKNISTAVLTRGYKRKQNKLEIVGAGADLPEVERLGDEPWMIKRRHPWIALLVHPDRARMALRHWEKMGAPRLVILDDAFQHWKALRQRDVLMLDASESLTQGKFPFGRLRESAAAVARADLVVITRANSLSADKLHALQNQVSGLAAAPQLTAWKKERASRLRVVCADYAFDHFFDLDGIACARPEGKLVLAAGVAKPDGVRQMAKSLGLAIQEEIYFPDHHRLSRGELFRLRDSLKANGDASLLLTEKDWARWRRELTGLKVFGMRVKFQFLADGEAQVQKFLEEAECSISR